MANPFLLDSDEQIIMDARRHWINIVPVWLSAVALVAVGIAVSYLFGRFPTGVSQVVPAFLPGLLVGVLVVLAGLILVSGLWVYRQNRLVLTTKHLIKVEQDGLFSRKVSQLSLSRVQDVNGSHRGILATILRFGTVEVQSAGEDEEFIFPQMPDPSGIADRLMKAHDQYSGQAGDGVD